MGICVSKKESAVGAGKKNAALKQQGGAAPRSLSPPSSEEEAVVKEVLTETPLPSSATTRSNSRKVPAEFPGASKPTIPPPGNDDNGSEVASEAYSASECFSVSTALTDSRSFGGGEEADGGEKGTAGPPRWWPPEWSSPAGKSGGTTYHQNAQQRTPRRSSAPGESPSRRDPRTGAAGSSPSPVRRPHAGNVNGAAVVRKGPGDRSGRRSISPATKQAAEPRAAVGCGGGGGVSRSSSMRKLGAASPRRPRPAPRGDSFDRTAAATGVGGKEVMPPPPPPPWPKESVENPFVSFECFIFL